MLGHVDTVYVCHKHGEKRLDECEKHLTDKKNPCSMIPLRTYLAERNRLVTGKTK